MRTKFLICKTLKAECSPDLPVSSYLCLPTLNLHLTTTNQNWEQYVLVGFAGSLGTLATAAPSPLPSAWPLVGDASILIFPLTPLSLSPIWQKDLCLVYKSVHGQSHWLWLTPTRAARGPGMAGNPPGSSGQGLNLTHIFPFEPGILGLSRTGIIKIDLTVRYQSECTQLNKRIRLLWKL